MLYYQAVDINLPSLGLRPPVPAPVPVAIALDDNQAPTLPPGLTTEHDSSDLAESSGPTTPAPSNPTYSPKISSSPTHSKPNLPPHDLPPPPPIPQQPPHKSQGGLFQAIRRAPSLAKIGRHSGEKLEAVSVSTNSSASGSTSSPANVLSSHNKFELIPSIPGSPSVEPTSPKSNLNGKERWYRRKGTKHKGGERDSAPLLKAPLFEKRPTTVLGKQPESLAPPSPASTVDSSSQRSSSPSHPHSESEVRGEKSMSSPNLTRKPSAPVSRHSPPNSRLIPLFAKNVPAVPPLPSLSSSPAVQVQWAPIPRPQAPRLPRLPFNVSERRATVVGDGTTDQKTELNGHAKLNGDVAGHHPRPRPSSLHADMLPTASSSSSELLTPTPGHPLEDNNPLLSAGPSTSVATSAVTTTGQGDAGDQPSWRRKLSITSGFLPFTKKEKHKERAVVIPQGL